MTNDGSFSIRLSGVDLPDARLREEKGFQRLQERNPMLADAILTMKNGTRDALATMLNRRGNGWADLIYVDSVEFRALAEEMDQSDPASPQRKQAQHRLGGLIDAA